VSQGSCLRVCLLFMVDAKKAAKRLYTEAAHKKARGLLLNSASEKRGRAVE